MSSWCLCWFYTLTFLTRSGGWVMHRCIHFTDLGLPGNCWFTCSSLYWSRLFTTIRWTTDSDNRKETAVWSREFWILLVLRCCAWWVSGFPFRPPFPFGTGLLKLWRKFKSRSSRWSADVLFQISIVVRARCGPLYQALVSFSGGRKWTAKCSASTNCLFPSLLRLLLVSVVIINIAKTYNIGYSLLLFAGLFTFFQILKFLFGPPYQSVTFGGAVVHIGIGLMLIGIMFFRYSRVVSLNNTGMLISKQLSEEFNRENPVVVRKRAAHHGGLRHRVCRGNG